MGKHFALVRQVRGHVADQLGPTRNGDGLLGVGQGASTVTERERDERALAQHLGMGDRQQQSRPRFQGRFTQGHRLVEPIEPERRHRRRCDHQAFRGGNRTLRHLDCAQVALERLLGSIQVAGGKRRAGQRVHVVAVIGRLELAQGAQRVLLGEGDLPIVGDDVGGADQGLELEDDTPVRSASAIIRATMSLRPSCKPARRMRTSRRSSSSKARASSTTRSAARP